MARHAPSGNDRCGQFHRLLGGLVDLASGQAISRFRGQFSTGERVRASAPETGYLLLGLSGLET